MLDNLKTRINHIIADLFWMFARFLVTLQEFAGFL